MPFDLVSSSEIARALGVSQSYVNRLARNDELPEPDGVVNAGQRVWRREVIEAWAKANARKLQWP